jgi:hypothetical protein
MDKTTRAVPTSAVNVHRITFTNIKIPSKTGWSLIFPAADSSAMFNLAPQAGHSTGGFSAGNCFSQSGHFILGRLTPSLIHNVRLVEPWPGRELKKICRHHLKRLGAFRFLIPSRAGGPSCAATRSAFDEGSAGHRPGSNWWMFATRRDGARRSNHGQRLAEARVGKGRGATLSARTAGTLRPANS